MAESVKKALQIVRFLLRLLLFATLTISFAVVDLCHGIILSLITFKPTHTFLNHFYGPLFARAFAFLGGTAVEVCEGKEHLDKDQCFVIVSNHQSSLDMLAMLAMWPKKTSAVGKKSILFFPIFGVAAYLNGTIMINRKDSEGAKQQLNAEFEKMLPRKERIWFFPEGTRNRKTGDMLPFKKGAFHMAVANQVPIVPVVFSSISDFYSKSELRWDAGTIRIGVLPPVKTEGLTKDDLPDLMKDVSSQMQGMLDKLNSKSS